MSSQELPVSSRVQSVDILRGAVMVLMAIDHVRVYSGLPPGGPDPGIFFTRWVTNFCAPAFVFLAGTGAFFYGRKIADTGALARYLATRGLILVVLELTLIRLGWTFNFNYSEFVLAGVIWMLGWSMILLALLVRARPTVVGLTGLAIIFFQQLFSGVPGLLPVSWQAPFGSFWEYIYPAGLQAWSGLSILYVIVPWVGVMAAGYGFGAILATSPEKRNKTCLQIGLSSIALYFAAATALLLSRPSSPEAPPFIFRLLNQQKYPPSQLFLLMTLGPVIALVPMAEKARGKMAEALKVFGRVPLFYYLLHIPLIHATALLVNWMTQGAAHQEWYAHAPYASVPADSRWTLTLLYLIFAIDVGILYFACRAYARYKFNHPESKWLRFI